jgi:hypothetical protein
MIPRTLLLAVAAALVSAADWMVLFDGKTFANWNDPSKMNPPGDSWTIEEGCLKAKSHPKLREDLVSQKSFGDFELEFEWKIGEKGNSGVKYRIQELATLTSANHPPNQKKFEDWVNHVLLNNLSDRSKMRASDDNQIYAIGFEYQMIDDTGNADARRGSLFRRAGCTAWWARRRGWRSRLGNSTVRAWWYAAITPSTG